MLKVRGYTDEQPIYGKDRNWSTEVHIGDFLLCSFSGFGSEMLHQNSVYKVIELNGEIILHGSGGEIIDAWNTKNTMPFFLKCHSI